MEETDESLVVQLKLISGEDLIAELVLDGLHVVIITDPLVVVRASKTECTLIPWSLTGNLNHVYNDILKTHILTYQIIDGDGSSLYKRIQSTYVQQEIEDAAYSSNTNAGSLANH